MTGEAAPRRLRRWQSQTTKDQKSLWMQKKKVLTRTNTSHLAVGRAENSTENKTLAARRVFHRASPLCTTLSSPRATRENSESVGESDKLEGHNQPSTVSSQGRGVDVFPHETVPQDVSRHPMNYRHLLVLRGRDLLRTWHPEVGHAREPCLRLKGDHDPVGKGTLVINWILFAGTPVSTRGGEASVRRRLLAR